MGIERKHLDASHTDDHCWDNGHCTTFRCRYAVHTWYLGIINIDVHYTDRMCVRNKLGFGPIDLSLHL